MPERIQAHWPFAVEHAAADHRCDRKWVCACGPCRVIRKYIRFRENQEPTRGIAWSYGYKLLRLLGEVE
jgi:hypothetical protein